ncbi:hypothetical protein BSL78_08577 [Apostichopus japonicus]|uniref:SAM domain-containing protein n=1 Tax=Stichopus japonicus TaxID=307972 RepID=A0A2G8L2M7_STIJA|nr:hypothetical protein BSL78_08577 [Apostichopus japonicus]
MANRPLPSIPSSQLTYENVLDDVVDAESRKIRFKLEEGDTISGKSKLGKLLLENSLPLIVNVKEDFMDSGDQLIFGEGECVLLHFLRCTRGIQAIDPHGKSRFVPMQTSGAYELLPQNPLHDDQVYCGTLAVIQSKPLPRFVRILQTEPSTSAGRIGINDVLSLTRVEEKDGMPNHLMLVGTCKGKLVKISQQMKSYVYTTMLSEELFTLSEITTLNEFPVRVRQVNSDEAFLLTEIIDETRVIATRMNHPLILSIPVTSQLNVEKFQEPEAQKLFKGLLPVGTYSIIENGNRDVYEVNGSPFEVPKTSPVESTNTKGSEITPTPAFRHSLGSEVRISQTPESLDLLTATVEEVLDFLCWHKFDAFLGSFWKEKIDGKILCQFDETEIQRRLKMPRIQAKRLALEIKHSRDQAKTRSKKKPTAGKSILRSNSLL